MDAKTAVLKRYLTGVFGTTKQMSKQLELPQVVFSRAFRGSYEDMKDIMVVLEAQNRATWVWLEGEAAKERENLHNIIKYQNKSIRALQKAQDLLKSKKA